MIISISINIGTNFFGLETQPNTWYTTILNGLYSINSFCFTSCIFIFKIVFYYPFYYPYYIIIRMWCYLKRIIAISSISIILIFIGKMFIGFKKKINLSPLKIKIIIKNLVCFFFY
uniref:hypothetical protein n=1 Tax=Polyozellus multiplex TaxID=281719 RepID=UPI001F13082E|nr:hypothetical protein MN596_mgp27 [Polyozellus multiplex]UMI33296.1 hypothetical protein [Polyozellus multiplex]